MWQARALPCAEDWSRSVSSLLPLVEAGSSPDRIVVTAARLLGDILTDVPDATGLKALCRLLQTALWRNGMSSGDTTVLEAAISALADVRLSDESRVSGADPNAFVCVDCAFCGFTDGPRVQAERRPPCCSSNARRAWSCPWFKVCCRRRAGLRDSCWLHSRRRAAPASHPHPSHAGNVALKNFAPCPNGRLPSCACLSWPSPSLTRPPRVTPALSRSASPSAAAALWPKPPRRPRPPAPPRQ